MDRTKEIVGLIPAAGFASRISSLLTGSKEVYPILLPDGTTKAALSFLMESLIQANANKGYLILREGKWDIPEYFLEDNAAGIPLAYIISESTNGVPYTLDKAYSFIKDSIVLLGFPDIIFNPPNAFNQLLVHQQNTGADLVLGLFKTNKPEKADMVDIDEEGNLKSIVIKPEQSQLIYTWIIAVWTPVFSHFMHDYLDSLSPASYTGNRNNELHIGDVVRAAIQEEIQTSYVCFDSGSFLDIGTPADLKKVNSTDWTTILNYGETESAS